MKPGFNHSIVRSITDDSSSVSAMDAISEDHCIVNGSLEEKDTGLLNVELIRSDAQIAEGNELLTSYLSDKFLPGPDYWLCYGYYRRCLHINKNQLTLRRWWILSILEMYLSSLS